MSKFWAVDFSSILLYRRDFNRRQRQRKTLRGTRLEKDPMSTSPMLREVQKCKYTQYYLCAAFMISSII